jgi:MFS family permease
MLVKVLDENIRTVFWIACLPAFAAVVVLILGVEESPRQVASKPPSVLPSWYELRELPRAFWVVTAIGAVVTLARFSEAFLVLRANESGLSLASTPLALVIMNAAYVASAYPAGWLSDRINRMWVLAIGLLVLIGADIALAHEPQLTTVMIGVAIWGLHMGLTQGLFAALVADAAPAELRGSAFGLFNFISGLMALVASLLAGGLWQWSGPASTFYAGAIFSAVALAGLLWWQRQFPSEVRK